MIRFSTQNKISSQSSLLKSLVFILVSISALISALASCSLQDSEPLPVITTLTVPYTFTDQDGSQINQSLFSDKIYVADFFFTSCPTICPIMKSQMLRVYEAFEDNDNVVLLSHTIDPEHDTVEVLKDYAEKLGISSHRWHMVTGPKDHIYDTAKRYMLAAMEDKQAPGGFIHSGSFSLVDRRGQIRGYYKGTEKEAVSKLIKDIRRLLNENQ
jgi:protein SCO1/2